MPSAPFYSPRSVALIVATTVDVSGVSTGGSDIVLPANPARLGLIIAAPSLVRVYVNFGTPAVMGDPSAIAIESGDYWISEFGACPTEYVAIISNAFWQYTVKEFR